MQFLKRQVFTEEFFESLSTYFDEVKVSVHYFEEGNDEYVSFEAVRYVFSPLHASVTNIRYSSTDQLMHMLDEMEKNKGISSITVCPYGPFAAEISGVLNKRAMWYKMEGYDEDTYEFFKCSG